ncbi:GNAT family N-acetyltransferase [Microbacterium sp.]|uniref:GNAT family N-acetyltransferase n=1 Tax=Microbacterium sp. TaxID=51671 RepID=UPI0028120D46|nr:GNAT family N-acetyltransferase [Microbacterium sp.]
MTTATLTITPLHVPAALDADDAGEFLAYAELNRRICDEEAGIPELAPSAAEMLPAWLETADTLHTGFVARRDGVPVGMVTIDFPQEEGARTAVFDLLVAAEHWGRGVEQALLSYAENEARARGRSILQTWTLHRAIESDRMLIPVTGWGRIPANPLSEFYLDSGLSLEQVERNSELDLRRDPEPLRRALADAQRAAGDDYRTIAWLLPTPPELRDGYAAVLSRLSTDAPSGDLEIDEEKWDAERVVRRDRQLTGGGQMVSVAAVEHVPSGRIVAYNELLIGPDRAGVTHQFGTLVLNEHRGHRLGTIVKCANLLRWRELTPDSPRVSTFNAEENRPMLDINEAIGFVAVSYAGAWQKAL